MWQRFNEVKYILLNITKEKINMYREDSMSLLIRKGI